MDLCFVLTVDACNEWVSSHHGGGGGCNVTCTHFTEVHNRCSLKAA